MILRPTVRTRQPVTGVQIVFGSPLARGLKFAAIPVGGSFYDLVTHQLIMTTAATTESETPAVPGGTAAKAIYGSGSGSTAPRTLLDEIAGPHTLFVEGSLRVNASSYWAFHSGESGAGNGFAIKFDDVAIVNNSAIFWSNNGNRTNAGSNALGTDSEKYYHRLSVTNDGTNSRWYTKNGLVNTAAMTSLPIAHANRRTRMLTNHASDSGNAGVALVLAWDRVLSDAENAEVIRNPWQLFARTGPRIYMPGTAAGGAANLTIQDAAHAHAADNLALTSDSTLATAEAAHAHAADNLALTTDSTLAVQDASHAHTADNLDLTVTGSSDLSIQDATHAHYADDVGLETPRESTGNNFAGPRVIWKGRINKRWWLRDEDQDEEEPPKAIKKAARTIEKLAKAGANPAKIQRAIAPIMAAEPRIDWGSYFSEVAANLAAQQEQMREAWRLQLAQIVAQAAIVAQEEDDLEALLMLL